MRLFKIIYTCCSVLFCSSLLLRAEKLSSEELKTLSVLRGSVTIAVDEIDHRFVESNIGWDTLTVSPFSQMSMSYRYVMKTEGGEANIEILENLTNEIEGGGSLLNELLVSDKVRELTKVWLAKNWELYYSAVGVYYEKEVIAASLKASEDEKKKIFSIAKSYWDNQKDVYSLSAEELIQILEPDWQSITYGEVANYFSDCSIQGEVLTIPFVFPLKWTCALKGNNIITANSRLMLNDSDGVEMIYGFNNLNQKSDKKRQVWLKEVILSRIAFEKIRSGKLPPWLTESEIKILEVELNMWWQRAKS